MLISTHVVDSEDAELDVEHLKNVFGFIMRSPRRHPVMAILSIVVGIGLGCVLAATASKEYLSEVSILIQRTSPLSNVTRTGPIERPPADPMVGVYEQVLRRDNLVSLAKSAHLVERMKQPKTGLARIKQTLQQYFTSPASESARLDDVVVTLLERNLSVRSEGNTFTISARWWDSETAYDLATLAQKSFFDDRKAVEVTAISDGIKALEGHAKTERDAVDDALRELDKARSALQPTPASGSARPSASGSPRPAPVRLSEALRSADPELTRSLEDKRRQIRELEDDRNRRLAELRTQLAGLLATYTPAHPSVASVQSRIDALATDTAAERQLKVEERRILESITQSAEESATRRATGSVGAAATAASAASAATRLSADSLAFAAPEVNMALTALQNRIRQYEQTMDRISAARFELDIAEKEFKHRYSLFRPAEMPQAPVKSKRVVFFIAGVVLSFIMAVFGTAAKDLLSGRILESWQVDRKLKLRLLGEASEP